MPSRRPQPSAVIHVVLGHDVFNSAEVLRGVGTVATAANAAVISTFKLPDPDHSRRRHPRTGVIVTPGQNEWFPDTAGWEGACVGLYSYRFSTEVAKVTPDDHVVGALAGEHLLDRGYRRLAFYGIQAEWSLRRLAGFTSVAKQAGVTPEVFLADAWEGLLHTELLGRFLALIGGNPLGVMAANDCIAVHLRDAVGAAGRDIPDDVGIIGVDNFEIHSAYGWVPISSIDVNSRRIGEVAAQLLLEMLDGRVASNLHREVLPRGVVPRLSTDVMHVTDADVARALEHMRSHLHEDVTAEDIARALQMSRTTLDRRFKECLGRTVADELRRLRLSVARRYLESSDVQLAEVATATGFKHLSNFSSAFRRVYGVTPSRWRAEVGAVRHPHPPQHVISPRRTRPHGRPRLAAAARPARRDDAP